MKSNLETRSLIVHGRVQGVGFRKWVKIKCDSLNITGKVWNTNDMKVELIASGKSKNLDKLFELCLSGPILSKVTKIDIKKINYEKIDSFEIIF